MQQKKSILFIVLALLFIVTSVQATEGPKPGQPMPDFTLDNITQYKTQKASLKDFRGKWLILDFWSTSCISCIQSFPKINELHKEFSKELNLIMVGISDTKYNKDIDKFYEKMRIKRNLEMPAAFDSVLQTKWDIHSLPYVIVIDPSGIVQFITDGRDMSKEKISKLLKGEPVSFFSKKREKPDFNPDTLAYDRHEFFYRSVLTKWNGEHQSAGYEIDRFVVLPWKYQKQGWSVALAPLYVLYNYAFVGRWDWNFRDKEYGIFYPMPVLEIKDSGLFRHSFGNDGTVTGMYNYNLTVPPAEMSKDKIMYYIQEDLKRYFKYEVALETRLMPVWKLIETKPGAVEKLKTRGGKKYISQGGSTAAGFTVINHPPNYLIGVLTSYLTEVLHIPFIDETGLKENFDFIFEADMTSITDIKAQLQKQGFDLVKGTKEMKCVVIRDPKTN